MSTPFSCLDRATEIIPVLIAATRHIYDPAGEPAECRPLGEGSTDVKFFASQVTPLAAWDSFSSDEGCKGPFLWVRLVSRFRSDEFPQQSSTHGPCKGTRVLELEVGVGRCVKLDAVTDWAVMSQEMEISRDDSYRIEQILCLASGELSNKHGIGLIGTDTIVPYGPDGGIQGWSGVLYVGY